MWKVIFFVLFPVFLVTGTKASDNTSSRPLQNQQVQDSSRAFREEFINILKENTPSLVGRTSQGNSYNLYAVKRGKEWTFIILDSTGYYSIRQIKGKDEVRENPQTYTEMLCLMIKAKMLKRVNKPKNIEGLTLSSYYKFKPKAKKMYRSFNQILTKAKLFQKTIKSPGGIGKILKKSIK